MSVRSLSIPPSPGPPPVLPPPPTPGSSSASLPPPSPRPRGIRSHEAQWPTLPQSQQFPNAIIWPEKAPRRSQAMPELPPEPLEHPRDARRTSLSSLSLNRFSIHSAKKSKNDAEPEPPLPSPKPKKKHIEIRASVANSRGVQRRTSGVERRVSASKTGYVSVCICCLFDLCVQDFDTTAEKPSKSEFHSYANT